VPVRIALAEVVILLEEALRGVVVSVQDDGRKVKFLSSLRDVIRRGRSNKQYGKTEAKTGTQQRKHTAHVFPPDCDFRSESLPY